MKAAKTARFGLGVVLVACALQSATAQAPMFPPGFPTPKPLPPLSHESHPDLWPQPDYFAEALALTPFKPSTRSAGLANSLGAAAAAAQLIVLPVQSQAFGFSSAFRAVIGAQLDRRLERDGLAATRQTDVADAYGPFVRRLDDAQISALVKDYPSQRVLALYLGHDGIDQAFVTLTVRDAHRQSQAHKTVALPSDPAAAETAIANVLPDLLKTAGLSSPAATPRIPLSTAASSCSDAAWSLAATSEPVAPIERACRALAMSALLPTYGGAYALRSGESISPAALAWLAEVHVYAAPGDGPPALVQAIQDLAASRLGLSDQAAGADLLAYRASADPLVSRVARLTTIATVSRRSPASSTRESRQRELDHIVQGLPAFAAALVRARGDLEDPFLQVDFCAIERSFPGALMRRSCGADETEQTPPRARIASPSEALLYQEWRLARYVTELRYYGSTQGNPARTDETLRRLPDDVAQHPYVQRLRYELSDRTNGGGSFDDLLKRMREAAQRTAQTTVDLQRADLWLAAHSLTEHTWTNNLNVMNDAEVRVSSDAELRLLEVLRFDRFAPTGGFGGPPRRRQVGDGAYFLAVPAAQIRMLSMNGGRPFTVPAASAPVRPVDPVPYKPRLFQIVSNAPWIRTAAMLESDLAQDPMDMGTRVELALQRLKAGGSVADARRLIDARQADERSDYRVGESHTLAEPAHAFYFAGEPAAARVYYDRVRQIGTGSDSDLIAQVRLEVLDGHLRRALDATSSRLRRYDSDYARRDLVGLLFMLNRPEEAWTAFMPRAASSSAFQLWLGAYTGHRIAGADLPTAAEWLGRRGIEGAQIDFAETSDLYLHLLAVTDRVPTDADIALLEKPRGKRTYVDRLWSASARLIRSAMEGTSQQEAQAYAARALASRGSSGRELFVLPAYAWVSWQATQGRDEALADVRAASLQSSFDEVLAKSMLLALEGQTAESLQYLTAARFALASLGRGEMVNRPIPAPYQFALAGYLMFEKTRDESYRRQTLNFVRAYQKVHPFLGWLYSIEALLEDRPKERLAAACRAKFLDPESHFLKLAHVTGLDKPACTAWMWR